MSADEGEPVWIDIDDQCAHKDYTGIFDFQAASPTHRDSYRPSTLSHGVPLSAHLGAALRRFRDLAPTARRIGILLPQTSLSGGQAVADLGGYKLRATLARFRAAVTAMLLDAGLDRTDVAIATGAMHLIPRSRPYYALVPTDRLRRVHEALNEMLVWGTPAAYVGDVGFGPPTVPTREAVKQAHDRLQRRIKRRPPTGCRLRTLMRFNNRFMAAAGVTLDFCAGKRPSRLTNISARYWRPGVDSCRM